MEYHTAKIVKRLKSKRVRMKKSDVLKLEYKDYKTNEFYSYCFTNYPYIAISQSCMHGKEKL